MRIRCAPLIAPALLLAMLAVAAPAGSAAASDPTQTNYSMGVLVLKYFPLTSDGKNIDINVTGDVGDPVGTIRAKTDTITTHAIEALQRGSSYHGYVDASATPSLTYHVVDTKELDVAVPTVANPAYAPPDDAYSVRPNYPLIMQNMNICDYVQNRGVNEVWMFAYQGSDKLQIDESKMSGPNGDSSNEWFHDALPICTKTYTLMTYNYARDTASAVHSHGHQLERELNAVDTTLFSDKFEGPAYPGLTSDPGRCGSVDIPPIAKAEYDWNQTVPHASDCENWNPDALGPTKQLSCTDWACSYVSDTDNYELDWQVFWMQNMPGKGNTVTYGGRPMRNWWDVHGDWDHIMSADRSLILPTPTLACRVSYVPNTWLGGFTANITITNTSTVAVNGWTLRFAFPGDQHVTGSWNATAAQTAGAVALTNVASDASIAPAASAYLGIQGTWTSRSGDPAAFTLNGLSCGTS